MSQRFTKGWASENKSFYEVGAAYLDFWRNLFPIFTQFALVDTKEGNLEVKLPGLATFSEKQKQIQLTRFVYALTDAFKWIKGSTPKIN